MQNITPFLWYDDKAEEAMNFYVSIFPRSKVKGVARYGEAGPGPKGSVMTASFELDGVEFTALNGGPHFKFTEAVSFVVHCKDQKGCSTTTREALLSGSSKGLVTAGAEGQVQARRGSRAERPVELLLARTRRRLNASWPR